MHTQNMKAWFSEMISSKSERVETAMSNAAKKVTSVADEIEKECSELKSKHQLNQSVLLQMVNDSRPTQDIIKQTNKVKMIEKTLRAKTNLLGNMNREHQQLSSAKTNTDVALAMKESVDAQRLLVRVNCDEADLDELLDDVDDYRQETVSLAERLGAMGGDDDADLTDDTIFDTDAIMSAMGRRTDCKEQFRVDELRIQLAQNSTIDPNVNSDFENDISYILPDAPSIANTPSASGANNSHTNEWNF